MRASRVLVADRDPTIHELVRSGLPDNVYSLTCVSDGQEALKAASEWSPDILMLEIGLPRIDGIGLVRTLRSKPGLSLVPAIFFDERKTLEPRISGFKLGADEFLPHPLNPEDLAPRISMALAASAAARKIVHAHEPGLAELEFSHVLAGFRGSLEQVGLPSLLSLMELERKTGMLVLILQDQKKKARIYLRDGKVLWAQYDKQEEPRDAELIYQLLAQTAGKFDFRPRAVTDTDRINLPTARILLEGARLMDEERRRSEGV